MSYPMSHYRYMSPAQLEPQAPPPRNVPKSYAPRSRSMATYDVDDDYVGAARASARRQRARESDVYDRPRARSRISARRGLRLRRVTV